MGPIHSLATINHPNDFLRMSENILDFSREIISVSQLEQRQFLRAKIVQNARSAGGNDRLTLRQILKYTSGRVQLGEYTSPIRDDTDVALADSLGNLF